MNLMEQMMFAVHRSKLGFDETVAALIESAKANGWSIPMTHDLQQNYIDAGHEDMTKVQVLYFCNPDGGYRILQDDAHKPMSVMMPMGVSVYETTDGEVYVAGMNLAQMSAMFGGTVKEVLQEGAANYKAALAEIAEPVPPKVQVDSKKVAAGCAIAALVVGGLLLLLVVVAINILPKVMVAMMQTVMPKMMDEMEKAGVKPPCADLILKKMEADATA